MARRRKGRDISGWMIVDKPAGVTSTAAVNAVRRALNARKAGHAGTLDPAATGVLAVALGEATKTVPFVTDALKAYRFTVTFGAATDTDDAEGEVIATSAQRPSDAEVAAALTGFEGEIMQVPPRYSAVRVEGARAYDLARSGEEVDLAARPLWVEEIALVARPDRDTAEIEMVCGKGGYVRAVARDLGAALGTCAHVRSLRRTWSGPFGPEGLVPLATIEEEAGTPELESRLLPLEAGLALLPELPCDEAAAARLRHGNPAPVHAVPEGVEFGDTAWASRGGRAIAVGRYRAGALHPDRVFAA